MVIDDDSLLDVAGRDEVSERDGDPVPEGADEVVWWKARYQAERARAEAAQALCETLRWAEVKARSEANSYKVRVEASRRKLQVERKALAQVRIEAKAGLAQHAEVVRLRQLLDEAGGLANPRAIVTALRKKVHELQRENAALKTQLDESRSIRVGLSKTLYGQRSEQQTRPPSARKPGQQRGGKGHGRPPRPGLEEKGERHDPPKADRTCGTCGKPYVANGGCPSTVIEVEVKAYTRKIIRSRWQAGCGCDPDSPEVIAPAVGRLFRGTAFGVSFWTWFLRERFVFNQPYRRIGARLADSGLSISAGTLADRTAPFMRLFAPLAEAIGQRQNQAVLRQADETRWPVQAWTEERKSSRGWLWVSLSNDAVFLPR